MFPSKQQVACFCCDWNGRKDKARDHCKKQHTDKTFKTARRIFSKANKSWYNSNTFCQYRWTGRRRSIFYCGTTIASIIKYFSCFISFCLHYSNNKFNLRSIRFDDRTILKNCRCNWNNKFRESKGSSNIITTIRWCGINVLQWFIYVKAFKNKYSIGFNYMYTLFKL